MRMKQASAGALERALRGRLRAAAEWSRRHVDPARGALAVAVAAALALAGSQLVDYRGVSVGAAAYAAVEGVASAPEIARERPSAAHGWAVYPIAIAALGIAAAAARGRWRLARLLVPLGLVAVAISVAVDAPAGLDAGKAELAYDGAEAVLLAGFWAQLAAGVALACCGPLLAAGLRERRRRERSEAGR